MDNIERKRVIPARFLFALIVRRLANNSKEPTSIFRGGTIQAFSPASSAIVNIL